MSGGTVSCGGLARVYIIVMISDFYVVLLLWVLHKSRKLRILSVLRDAFRDLDEYLPKLLHGCLLRRLRLRCVFFRGCHVRCG